MHPLLPRLAGATVAVGVLVLSKRRHKHAFDRVDTSQVDLALPATAVQSATPADAKNDLSVLPQAIPGWRTLQKALVAVCLVTLSLSCFTAVPALCALAAAALSSVVPRLFNKVPIPFCVACMMQSCLVDSYSICLTHNGV